MEQPTPAHVGWGRWAARSESNSMRVGTVGSNSSTDQDWLLGKCLVLCKISLLDGKVGLKKVHRCI